MSGHVVAIGGGGFAVDPGDLVLDEFALALSPRQPPRVCFLPTASGDSATYLVKFYRTFSGRCTPTDLTVFDSPVLPRWPPRSADLAAHLAEQDVICVGGGNTANMLSIWRAHGVDVLLREAWSRGAVLTGVSAGMICWFRGGLTDSFGALEPLRDGLGLVEATACPHYDSEEGRRPAYHQLIADGFGAGYAADDGAALHFTGSELTEVVSSRPEAGAYRVDLVDGKVVETRLPCRRLNA